MDGGYLIITFYEFKRFEHDRLGALKTSLRAAMREHSIKGTIILATEGFNATVCGAPATVEQFVIEAETILHTTVRFKSSIHPNRPFRKIDVKIKPEIVTLKQTVDMSLGDGTHVNAAAWNDLISDPSVVVLDTRNDYEYRTGTFRRALNPGTGKFSELPAFVAEHLDPEKQQRVAMFCTGGIRCEKFAPYLRQRGFKEVFQLEGGILKYLEETPPDDSLWEGECFVFDDRISVDRSLRKGESPDRSQQKKDEE